jgi:hypothetical protein
MAVWMELSKIRAKIEEMRIRKLLNCCFSTDVQHWCAMIFYIKVVYLQHELSIQCKVTMKNQLRYMSWENMKVITFSLRFLSYLSPNSVMRFLGWDCYGI